MSSKKIEMCLNQLLNSSTHNHFALSIAQHRLTKDNLEISEQSLPNVDLDLACLAKHILQLQSLRGEVDLSWR
jgi:hypothetical protein